MRPRGIPWLWWGLLWVLLFGACLALHGERISPDRTSPARDYLLTGDEPHYLLVTHSLAFDGDIDLANNLASEDWRLFSNKPVSGYVKNKGFWLSHVGGRLRGMPDDYWERRRLSVLPVGMPLLLAPWYRLGVELDLSVRYVAALFFHALAALTAVLMAWLCSRITGRPLPAVALGVLLSLSPPLMFYSSAAFPDLPGALCIVAALCLLWLVRSAARAVPRLVAAAGLGGVCGFLPWLHARFWIPAGLLSLFFLGHWLRQRQRDVRLLLTFLGFLTPGIVLLARYYLTVFGVPYPVSTHPPLTLLTGVFQGWPGLIFDRDAGLLFYAPLAFMGLCASPLAWRRGDPLVRLSLALVGAQWLMIGMFRDWHGGLCPPLRYWVSVAPLLLLPAAILVERARSPLARAAVLGAGLAGLAIGVYGQSHAKLLYTYRHPFLGAALPSAWWEWAPQFLSGNHPSLIRSLAAMAVFIALCAVIVRGQGARGGTAGKADPQ